MRWGTSSLSRADPSSTSHRRVWEEDSEERDKSEEEDSLVEGRSVVDRSVWEES